jgi:hypothetical protein
MAISRKAEAGKGRVVAGVRNNLTQIRQEVTKGFGGVSEEKTVR